VLNRIAKSVVEARRGISLTYVFTYKGKPITRMMTAAWKRARIRAKLPQVRMRSEAYHWATLASSRGELSGSARSAWASLRADHNALLGRASSMEVVPFMRVNDMSRAVVPLEQSTTLALVVEMAAKSWLAAGTVPGIERQPMKKLELGRRPWG
jgi:hypothetical protein